MDRSPLGQLLVQWGCIGPDQLARALEAQRHSKRRIGALLVEHGDLTQKELAQVLSFQLTLPCVTLGNLTASFDLRHTVPRALAVAHRLVPVFKRGESDGPQLLYVATDDPTNETALAACARESGMTVRPMVASHEDVSRALEALHGVPATDWPKATPVAPRSKPTRPTPPAEEPVSLDDDLHLLDDVVDEDELDDDIDFDGVDAGSSSRAASTPVRMAVLAPVAERSTAIPPSLRGTSDHVTVPAPDSARLEADAAPAAPRPLLVLGASPRFVERLESLLDVQELPVVRVTLGSVRQSARELGPIALVVMEEVYAFDRTALNTLALEVGAPLVVWSDDVDVESLQTVVLAAQNRRAAQRRAAH